MKGRSSKIAAHLFNFKIKINIGRDKRNVCVNFFLLSIIFEHMILGVSLRCFF